MDKPLQGVRVIDMSHVIAGPLASHYLAQLGAEVIKVEPTRGEVMRNSRAPGEPGGGMPSGFVALNAGKRSLAVDIRQPEGADIVRALARTADVFIENFRPGVVARHGLGYEDIRAVRPDVVYCSISGFGQQGEWAGRGAYDHVVQALTGMMMMAGGDEEAPPVKVGFPVIDVAVGMLGALSVTAALHQRNAWAPGERRSQHIDASMLQASLMLMYPHACTYLTHGVEPRRVGNRGYTGSPAADTYRCADGWLSTAANTPQQFRRLASVLGLDALCEDATLLDLDAFNAPEGGFVAARDASALQRLQACLAEAFAARNARDMEARLNAVGVPAARVRRLGEFLGEARAAGTVSPVSYGAGGAAVDTPGLGFRWMDAEPLPGAPAPALGDGNLALLRELGMADEAIARLCRSGVLGASQS
ncbi:CaiB/BaiF CoA transferase family protein [Delftia acidovorans]|uniref:CaiB/BaiF CoA transferase family protein n=1 Tax=Delftia acidovorans TaxID=80866 RepID=UPI000F4C5B2A|nr:CoA transferase [Delftia acidovorans]ROQ91409.1 crotonobetainyl-CoA:carnitine CoA-transferase CaiB-like acyl-CoA transferase [Delftia acidovorans]